ncbi:MAG: hypothetical protein OQK73_12155 [Gammaproteobacteria bacterium]|nr:hypothetical protein [Gammaproteobacteria bacterium]
MKGIYLDSQTRVTGEFYAIVHVPGRHRKRYSETSVQLVDSPDEALSQADPQKKFFAAKVMGPARSSEGVKLYYLLEWLN